MNFIPQTSPSLALMWLSIAAVVLVAAGVIVANIRADFRRTHGARLEVLSGLSALVVAFFLVFAVHMGCPSAPTQRLTFKERAQDRYGLKLTDEQIAELKYPGGRPDGGLETYGATILETKVEGNLYRKQKVQLISEDGKLRLATYKDGKGFEELPRKDANR